MCASIRTRPAGNLLAILGVVIGVAPTYVGGRLVASRLYDVRAEDPAILIAAVAALITITLAAYLIPAVRASRVTPAEALKAE